MMPQPPSEILGQPHVIKVVCLAILEIFNISFPPFLFNICQTQFLRCFICYTKYYMCITQHRQEKMCFA